MRRQKKPRTQREPTIALINIVFLLLVFFMVAGTLAPPLDSALALVETRDLEGREPPDALVIHPDGRLSYRGTDQAGVAQYIEQLDTEERGVIRLVPDKELDAAVLVSIARDMQQAGVTRVMIVTKRGLE